MILEKILGKKKKENSKIKKKLKKVLEELKACCLE